MINELKVLDSVDICILDKSRDKKTYYKTNILEKADNNIFYTGYIMGLTNSMISHNSNLEYTLFSKSPKGIFCWKIIYLGNKKLDHVLACEFQIISDATRTQKREFFRQPLCLPISFSTINYEGKKITDDTIHDGTMINISGGGCAFTSQNNVRSNYIVNITFQYKKFIYCLNGRVLSSVKAPVTNIYEHRIQWENNNPKIIEDIIKLLCIIQREKINT